MERERYRTEITSALREFNWLDRQLVRAALWFHERRDGNRTTGAAEAQQTPGGAEKSQELTTTNDR